MPKLIRYILYAQLLLISVTVYIVREIRLIPPQTGPRSSSESFKILYQRPERLYGVRMGYLVKRQSLLCQHLNFKGDNWNKPTKFVLAGCLSADTKNLVHATPQLVGVEHSLAPEKSKRLATLVSRAIFLHDMLTVGFSPSLLSNYLIQRRQLLRHDNYYTFPQSHCEGFLRYASAQELLSNC